MAIWFELGIFLVVLAFGLWQLHDVKKAIREREQREAKQSGQDRQNPGA